MTITLAGNNSYELKKRLDELTAKFKKENGELALERIDASEVESEAITEAAGSLPFLAKRKMLVVRDLSQNKLASELIEQIISSVDDNVDLILYEPSIDRRTSYFKELKKLTKLEEYNQLDAQGLAKWLVDLAKSRDAELSFANANYLVTKLGENQMRLSNELDKLATYNNQISRQNIDLLVEPSPQSRVFDLLDAAFGGNRSRALELYRQQRAQKVEPQEILGLIAWQLRLIVLAKVGDDKSSAQIAGDAGLNPYPVAKAQSLAAKLSDTQLKRLVNEAYEIDQLAKTKPIELDEALKNYITTL